MNHHLARLSALALCTLAAAAAQAAGYYSAQSTSAVTLSATPGAAVTVVQVDVPAGTWSIAAKANIVNWANKDYDRCGITAGATSLDGSTTMTGEMDGFPAVAQLTNLAQVTTVGTQTIKLVCWHDFAVAGQYADPGATLQVSRAPKK